MAQKWLASCIADLNRGMNVAPMAELLLQDGVLSVAEYSHLHATIQKSGEVAGSRSLTCLLLGKSEAELSVFSSHLRELQPDLADLLQDRNTLPRVSGAAMTLQAETAIPPADLKLAGCAASPLLTASASSTADTDDRDVELQALRAERDLIAAKCGTVAGQRDTIAVDRDIMAAERDIIAAERDIIAAERDTVVAKCSTMAADRDAIDAKRDSDVATITADRDVIAAERDTLVAERDALLTTVAECASMEYERAPAAVQHSVRNAFRLRHAAILANYPRPLPKWRTVGSIPEDVRLCSPHVFQGHMYLSVTRRGSEAPAILWNALHALGRPWSEVPLPPAPAGKAWERVGVFCSETALCFLATTDYKSVPFTILELRDGGDWLEVTQLPSVRKHAGYAICGGSIVVAGGQNRDGTPCSEISMFPLRAEESMRKWRQIGKLDELRFGPSILPQGKRVHVVGGGGMFKDALTSILTLTPAPSGAQLPFSYSQSTSAVAAAPLRFVGAVMARDCIVTAGGWQQHSAGSSTGDCSDQCSMWDSGTRGWLPLPPLSMKQTRPFLFFHDAHIYCVWGDKSQDRKVLDSNHTIEVLSV